uniref:V-type proton ATPase subunit F n=1 Tax=Parastrongyloides trichosuri TaxID=131310 RepID=A0A0N4Z7C0_PARTI
MVYLPQTQGRMLSVIGDEDTIVGFLLGGIGGKLKNGEKNFFIVDDKTPIEKIEESFKKFTSRADIAIIIINQNIAEKIRPLMNEYSKSIPAILEVPSKTQPYDPRREKIVLKMGNVVSAFGFNQPFLFALFIIVILLAGTVALVNDSCNDNIFYDTDTEGGKCRSRVVIEFPKMGDYEKND